MRGHSVIYIPKRRAAFYPVNYGLLYNWWVTTDSRNICSVGWHIPTDAEWTTLTTYLGGLTIAGGKMKETGLTHWNTPNGGATNEVGFNGRGSGIRNGSNGLFSNLKIQSTIWSSTASSSTNAYYRLIKYSDATVTRIAPIKSYGYCLRPFKDSTTLTHGQTGTYTGNDGKVYKTICIGTQEWLADNLAETKYRNGDWIHGFEGGTYTPISNAAWAALTTEGCCAYANNLANV